MGSYDGASQSLSSSVRAVLLPMFVYGCVLDFIHLSARVMDEIAKTTNLKVCPHTFVCGHVVYLMDSIKNPLSASQRK